MKLLLSAVAILVATLTLGTSAQSQNYPSCALYGRTPAGPKNCGFVSFEQCLAIVRGIVCMQNNTYQAPTRTASDELPARLTAFTRFLLLPVFLDS